jgi:hypothetical protein
MSIYSLLFVQIQQFIYLLIVLLWIGIMSMCVEKQHFFNINFTKSSDTELLYSTERYLKLSFKLGYYNS